MSLRCACYARVSTDKQNPLSIQDQFRKCREYAARQGWRIAEEHIYSDEALSGAGADRPGLSRLLGAAFSASAPFQAILVDDTSRLSRNRADIARLFEQLNFTGLRLVAVSQGIDTEHEQADVLLTVHGLTDSLYLKELGKKTHRGLEGQAQRGKHTGGRVFGYKAVPAEDGKGRCLVIEESEAAVVRRIFEMSASGVSLKAIAKALNRDGVRPAQPRAGNRYATWCPTAIQAMLRRELYAGRVVWNRSRFRKVPGTNRRVRQARPESQWLTAQRPELQIIGNELWQRVRQRFARLKSAYPTPFRPGLLPRAATSRYLFSGILKCGKCGANLVIVTGHGPGRHPKYGCSQHHNRGACSNRLLERQDWLEKKLLSEL